MKSLKASEEFVVGKHNIGWLYDFDQFKDVSFQKRGMPTFQKPPRDKTDIEIESELKPGLCKLGDVLAFLDNAPEECKDGYANLFYMSSCVVLVDWDAVRREWLVDTWCRDDVRWDAVDRVFSPATDAQSLSTGPSDTVTLPDTLTINGIKYKRV